MSLLDYKPKTAIVPIGNTTIEVRGLTVSHIGILVETNVDDLETVFNTVTTLLNAKDFENIDYANYGQIVTKFLSSAPALAANVIGLVAQEDAELDVLISAAGRLNIADQVKVMIEVLKLSFSEVGEVKKLIAEVLAMLPKEQPEPKRKNAFPKKAVSVSTTESDAT